MKRPEVWTSCVAVVLHVLRMISAVGTVGAAPRVDVSGLVVNRVPVDHGVWSGDPEPNHQAFIKKTGAPAIAKNVINPNQFGNFA